jgi:hypothetical protein
VASKDSSGQFRTINEALQAAVPATTRSAGSPSSSKKESTRRRFTVIGEGAGKSIGDNRGGRAWRFTISACRPEPDTATMSK